ncbi:MAG: iron-containing alcohol dehydrogenase family protein [Erysipelotrichaceae bacterium]|nr:iron-containing alcohol dehydrogenase family protein [Erysipelotrichaceae bacterium]
MKTILPHVTYGIDAYESIAKEVKLYGKKCALVYGEKAFNAARERLLPALEQSDIDIVTSFCYGHEATYSNVEKIVNDQKVKEADIIFAIGGGKCIDTVKYASVLMNKPLFTFPTIASTCAAVTKLSVIYNDDSSFKEVVNFDTCPRHTFIDTDIIAKSPDVYLWAGIGDTLAKYIECTFSARGDVLSFEQQLGVNTSNLCFYPLIKEGATALKHKKQQVVSDELTKTILNIIVSTGIVSICVGKDYNSALAHALNYGFSCRKHIEKDHYHGEVVSYGALVQLMMDKQYDDLALAYRFYKEIALPTKLADIGFMADDDLEDVLNITVINDELKHVPYPVTKELIKQAMRELEQCNLDNK